MERTIRVKGIGKLSVKPDTIRINMEATYLSPNYEGALAQSASDMQDLRNTVESAGLDSKDLKTTSFSIDSEYEGYHDKENNYRRRFLGYKYTHFLYIQFPSDNKKLSKVLTALAKSHVNVEFSIKYTVKDTKAAKNQLLAKAVEDSKRKAEILVEASGLFLGNLISIDYSWGEIKMFSEPMNKSLMSENLIYEASYNFEIEPDDIDMEDTVTLIWEIK